MAIELSLILPVYNEEKIIGAVLCNVISFLQKRFKKYEIIVVDDGSSDRSPAIIKDIAEGNREVIFVQHEKNKGYGSALRSGFKAASLDYIFFMDADGQFKIEDLDSILPLINEYDLIIGYRQKRNDPPVRVFLGTIFTKIINLCFLLHYKDINCAYKLIRNQDIEDSDLKMKGPLINAEILIKMHKRGLKIKEFPVPHFPRPDGQATGAKILTIVRAIKDFFPLIIICFMERG